MAENLDDLDISDEMIAERRSGDPGDLPDDMNRWMATTITWIDTIGMWTGRLTCFLLLPVMFAMVYEVVARKLFIAPTDWAFDVSRMLVGVMFMVGAGYALMRGVHIRADFLYRLLQAKNQALIDAGLYLLFFFPGMIFFFLISFDYWWTSLVRWELSMDTAWMAPLAPARTAMPLGAFFLLLQGVSELLKCFYAIKHNRWPS